MSWSKPRFPRGIFKIEPLPTWTSEDSETGHNVIEFQKRYKDWLFIKGFPRRVFFSLMPGFLVVGVNGEESSIDLMYEYHSTISKYFGSGFGVKLQYLDSEIAEAVMLRMLPEPCLPVHDSFIVRVGQTSKLKLVMDEEFEAATGVKAGIKIKLLKLSDDRKQIVKELIDDELSGFSTRLNKWRKRHHWKFFVDGGTASDVPQLTAR